MLTSHPLIVLVFKIVYVALGENFPWPSCSGALIAALTGLLIALWKSLPQLCYNDSRTGQRTSHQDGINMSELLRLLDPIQNWFLLGFHLGVPIDKLQEIRQNRRIDDKVKKAEVLTTWMNRTPPSWLGVVKALQQMEEHDLAQKIASEHGVSCYDIKRDDQLSALEEIYRELKEVKKWFIFGIHLGLPQTELKIIEQNNEPGDIESCKLDMLIMWTKDTCTDPTHWWSIVVSALKKMEYFSQAEHIQLKKGKTQLNLCAESILLILLLQNIGSVVLVLAWQHPETVQMIFLQMVAHRFMLAVVERCLIVVFCLMLPRILKCPQTSTCRAILAVHDYKSKYGKQAKFNAVQVYGSGHALTSGRTEITVKALYDDLKEVSRWSELAVSLNIPDKDIQQIYDDCVDPQECMIEVLTIWCEREIPSWKRIILALIRIEMSPLAIKIAKKHGVPYPNEVKDTVKKVDTNDSLEKDDKKKKTDSEEDIQTKMNEVPELKEMVSQINDVTTKWFDLGIHLRIPPSILKDIRHKYKDEVGLCKCHVLIEWSALEKPTWKKLTEALVDTKEYSVAMRIAIKHRVILSRDTLDKLKGVLPAEVTILNACTSVPPRECETEEVHDADYKLCQSDLGDMLTELQDVVFCWLLFGITFGVDKNEVMIIKADYESDGCKMCMVQLLLYCMDNEPQPTWRAIVETLIRMRKFAAAQRIAEKYGVSVDEESLTGPELTEKEYTMYQEITDILGEQHYQIQKNEQVIHELDTQVRKQERKEIVIKEAEKCDLCFMLDCTGSMFWWINELKKVISTISVLLSIMQRQLDLRVAFVRYTDLCVSKVRRTSSLDFTRNLERFRQFVGEIIAVNTWDTCEDVFGGLDAMLDLSWREEGTRVLVHIADAPCHGSRYHYCLNDVYREADSSGETGKILMKEVEEKQIFYYFGRIHQCTDAMISAFNCQLSYGRKIRKFDISSDTDTMEKVLRSVAEAIEETKQAGLNKEEDDTNLPASLSSLGDQSQNRERRATAMRSYVRSYERKQEELQANNCSLM